MIWEDAGRSGTVWLCTGTPLMSAVSVRDWEPLACWWTAHRERLVVCHRAAQRDLQNPDLTPASFLCEQQLEGDLETLALVTYSTLCLSMLALILTVMVLSCLRGLKSNTRSIHSNTAAAMFLSELVFLMGINQTEQQVTCVLVLQFVIIIIINY